MNSSTLNATNTTRGDFNYHLYYTVGIVVILVLSVLAVATVVSNGVFLWTFYKDPLKCLRTPSAIFIAGLTSANFLTGLIVEPALVVFYIIWLHVSNSKDVIKFFAS
ncbi:hypothetical protein OS493_015922 [Desmophyllum pertusum]|uniref:Uncharacterized protein n=1 Tax=Desmophyllum pertusum TaxID=174260 RepID=A0A9W9YCP9_9CNID|nr:hypothetical protein OS493_015922 [Desmophyllum pertusum]